MVFLFQPKCIDIFSHFSTKQIVFVETRQNFMQEYLKAPSWQLVQHSNIRLFTNKPFRRQSQMQQTTILILFIIIIFQRKQVLTFHLNSLHETETCFL